MRFTFFDCQIIEGKMQNKVHWDIRWVRAEELERYEFCPADVEVAERLRKLSNIKKHRNFQRIYSK